MGVHQFIVEVPAITIILFTALQAGQKCNAALYIKENLNLVQLCFRPLINVSPIFTLLLAP